MIDTFDINDSLGMSGFVILTDKKTGKILVKKHNMILSSAKRVLLAEFLNGMNNKINIDEEVGDDLDEAVGYKLSKVVFFKSKGDVSYTETLLGDVIDGTGNFESKTVSLNGDIFKLEIVDGRFRLNLKVEINNNEEETPLNIIDSLALVMSKGTSDLLFSRIKFDPINLTVDSSLSLTYYVYF